jgi:hypothetical protein
MNQQAFCLQPFVSLEIDLQISGNIAINGSNLVIHYQVLGDLSQIVIPHSSNLPTRQNQLWQETCFELFLGVEHSPIYWEFNLSPNGNWNVYRFDNYRQGMVEEVAIKLLPFSFQEKANSLLLDLEFDLGKLIPPNAPLEASITSVIKFKDQSLSYWAINHCGKEADFHQRNSFSIRLFV